MHFFQMIGTHLYVFAGYAVPFIFVLAIVIFVHELGHFLVGRWCGVGVKAFSLGFGPELLGFTDRQGTRWKLCAIPLGGYVKFLGDANGASVPDYRSIEAMPAAERAKSFVAKPVWQRAAIVLAGPVANFILAIVIFATVFMVFGRVEHDPVIGGVQTGSVAERAGFQAGDRIVKIDQEEVPSFEAVQRIVLASAGRSLAIMVQRGGAPVSLVATPEIREFNSAFGKQKAGMLGVRASDDPAYQHYETFGPVRAVALGAQECWFIIDRTLSYIGGVFTGRESADQISGLPRIAQVSGEAAKIGFGALFSLAAVLSVSIGLVNLFPVPLLDGGHLMFYAIEALVGRPLSERTQEIGFRIGFALVMMLMLFATWNDIVHLTTS